MSAGTPRISNRLAIKRKIKEEKGSDDEDSDFINPFKIKTGTPTTVRETPDGQNVHLVKSRRGRPPKGETDFEEAVGEDSGDNLFSERQHTNVKIVTVAASSKYNKRGRPRKYPKPSSLMVTPAEENVSGPADIQVTADYVTHVPGTATDSTGKEIVEPAEQIVSSEALSTHGAFPIASNQIIPTISEDNGSQDIHSDTNTKFEMNIVESEIVEEEQVHVHNQTEPMVAHNQTEPMVVHNQTEPMVVHNRTEPMVGVSEIPTQAMAIENTSKQVTFNVPGGAKVYFATAKALQESSAQFLIQRLSEQANHNSTGEIFPLVAASVCDKLLKAVPGSQETVLQTVFTDNGVSLQEKEGMRYASGSLDSLLKAREAFKKVQAHDHSITPAPDRIITPAQDSVITPAQDSAITAAQDNVIALAEDHVIPSPKDNRETEQDNVELIASESEEESGAVHEDSDPDYKPGKQDSYGVILVKAKQSRRGGKKCDQCDYKSSADGVKRHKLRMHPESLVKCEICGMTFGILYDMRRHRLTHFDTTGNLTTKGKELLMKYDPNRGVVALGDLEETFEPVEDIKTLSEICETKQESGEGTSTEVPDTQTPPGVDETINETETGFKTNEKPVEEVQKTPESTATATNLNVSVAKNTRVTCGLCQEEMTLTALRFHHNSHPKAIYKCPDKGCEQEGSHVTSLQNHYNKEHNTEDIPAVLDVKILLARCNECEFNDIGPGVIQHTVRDHPMTLGCTKCPATFTSEVQFRLHTLSSHTEKGVTPDSVKLRLPPKPKKAAENLKCSKCDRTFNHYQHYKKHLSTHCKNVYKCELCPYQSDKLGIVNHHIRQQHASVEDTTCVKCNKVFATPATLLYHIQTIHQQAQYCCDECGKNFTSKKYLQVHISRIHQKRLNHFCEVCGKGFYEKMRRDEHQDTHADASEKEAKKIYCCTHCGNRYARRFQLLQHENTHTGRRPYKCKQCGKGFAYASEVSKHMMAHREDRPFACTVCGKAFKFSYKLRSHMVIHTKQGKHSCQACGKVFTANSTLRKHACKAAPQLSVGSNKVVFSMAHPQQAKYLQELIVKHKSIVSAEDTDVVDGSLHVITPREQEGSLIERIVQAASQTEQEGSLADLQYTMESAETLVYPTDSQEDGEGGEGQEASEEGGVLYMCGICSSIFPSGEEVGVHMSEHGVSMVVEEEEEEAADTDSDTKTEIEIINQQQEEVVLSEVPGVHEVVALGCGVEEMQEVVSSSHIIEFQESQAAEGQEIVVHSEDVEAAANALTNLLG